MPRETTPCSLATPLARWASRRPMTAMLNTNGLPSAKSSRPRSRILATGTSGARPASKKCWIWEISKRSMPAGTGVWVVNTVDARPAARASSQLSGCSPDINSWIRSTPEEPGVALVGVEDLRRGDAREPLELAQRLDPAHAQQEFLLEPVVAAAAVQAVGDAAGGLVVARNVGVQQQQRDTSDVGPPDVRQQAPAVGERQRDLDGFAVAVRGGLAQQRQGQPVRVKDRIGFLLPGVAGERLLEVAGLVQQADADQRHAEVRGCLQVVAGQDAEAAGVLRAGPR